MTDDLVTEARKGGPCADLGDRCRAIEAASGCFCAAVADRIEALTAERDNAWKMVAEADSRLGQSLGDALQDKADNARLREALEQLACKCSSNCDWEHDDICPSWIAHAALTGKEPSHE